MSRSTKIFLFACCTLVAIAIIAVISPVLLSASTPTAPLNSIELENHLPGSSGWEVTNGARNGEIQAYAGENSLDKGENLPLYVSTTSPLYDIDIYRLGYYDGLGGRLMESIYGSRGIAQGYYTGENKTPTNCNTCIQTFKDSKGNETDITDANWKVTNSIQFPGTWVSGIYVIKLTESLQGYQWEVPVVLRDDHARTDLVFEDPVNTEQAYNYWGGTGLYFDFRRAGRQRAYYVSFDRPYIEDYGAMNLFRWTYPMLRFLEQEGYDVTYTENSAVSEGKTNLLNYKGFVVGGHDEYWNFAERQKLEAAIAKGVSAGFFGANDIYWQIRYTSDTNRNRDRLIICYKDAALDPLYSASNTANNYLLTIRWRDTHSPEDKILKAMYGASNSNRNQDLILVNTRSWVFNGTSIKDGYSIKGVLGFETDTLFDDGSFGKNDNVTIIARSRFIDDQNKITTAFAIIDELKKTGNIVFDAGTYLWPAGLSNFSIHHQLSQPIAQSRVLMQVTNNILGRIIYGKGSGKSAAGDSFSNGSVVWWEIKWLFATLSF